MGRRRVLSLLVVLLLISTSVVHAQQTPDSQPSSSQSRVGIDSLYPDPVLTPGAVFDGVTADQVCVAGYSSSVRDVSSGERSQVYAEYGIVDMPGADEVDHYIPLELGGSNDIANLWPEPYEAPGAHEKDRVENYLHDQVCSGALALGDAQQMILGDWYAVYMNLPESASVPTTSVVPQDT